MKHIIILVSIVLLFLSCDNGSMDELNPFVGTWEDSGKAENGYPWKDQLIFTENEVTKIFDYYKYVRVDSFNGSWEQANVTEIGTYQYKDSIIYFVWESGNLTLPSGDLRQYPREEYTSYSIKGNELILTAPVGTYPYKKVN
jgi:hypothetical protein